MTEKVNVHAHVGFYTGVNLKTLPWFPFVSVHDWIVQISKGIYIGVCACVCAI